MRGVPGGKQRVITGSFVVLRSYSPLFEDFAFLNKSCPKAVSFGAGVKLPPAAKVRLFQTPFRSLGSCGGPVMGPPRPRPACAFAGGAFAAGALPRVAPPPCA